jgi:hypothetical protein
MGTAMRRFPSAKHLASWAGVCPGNKQRAGKRLGGKPTHGDTWLWLKAMLGEVACSSASPTRRTPISPPRSTASPAGVASRKQSSPWPTRCSWSSTTCCATSAPSAPSAPSRISGLTPSTTSTPHGSNATPCGEWSSSAMPSRVHHLPSHEAVTRGIGGFSQERQRTIAHIGELKGVLMNDYLSGSEQRRPMAHTC